MKVLLFFLLFSSSVFAQQGWFYLNPTPTAASYYDLTMFSENSGICRSTKSIFKTHDGGKSWIEYNLANAESFINGFSMIDSSLGYIMTGAQNLLKTTDGGKNWNFVSQVYVNSRKLKFISPSEGFILTNEGSGGAKILKTINSGLNWIEYFSSDNLSLHDMYFVSSSIGFAVGSYPPNNTFHAKIFKTTNAGISWDSIQSTLKLASEKTFFVNENTGFICGSVYNSIRNRFLRTTDGGLSWGDTLKYNLSDIRFFDENTGYFISGDSIFR